MVTLIELWMTIGYHLLHDSISPFFHFIKEQPGKNTHTKTFPDVLMSSILIMTQNPNGFRFQKLTYMWLESIYYNCDRYPINMCYTSLNITQRNLFTSRSVASFLWHFRSCDRKWENVSSCSDCSKPHPMAAKSFSRSARWPTWYRYLKLHSETTTDRQDNSWCHDVSALKLHEVFGLCISGRD